MGFRSFAPQVAACPGCGRTTSTIFQELARDIETYLAKSMPEWRAVYPGVERLNVAVMGCMVNGPGESKHANMGVSLPRDIGEAPAAPSLSSGHSHPSAGRASPRTSRRWSTTISRSGCGTNRQAAE